MAERLALIRDLRYVSRHPVMRRALLAELVLAVVVIGVAVLLWIPNRQQHAELRVEVEQVRTEHKRQQEIEGVLAAAGRTRAMLAAAKQRLDATVEQADQVARLHEIAGRHGVVILSESNRQGDSREGYLQLLQEVVLIGDYIAIRRVIDDIYTLPSMTLPWDIVLAAADENGGKVRASMLLVTYQRVDAGGAE